MAVEDCVKEVKAKKILRRKKTYLVQVVVFALPQAGHHVASEDHGLSM